VGVFWSHALQWPLVWDQDEETAIQSPPGGTKIAWSGAAPAATAVTSRQRFDLVLVDGDRTTEVERLIALGATARVAGEDHVLLTDPDGIEFSLSSR
jgi:hypothetical protein